MSDKKNWLEDLEADWKSAEPGLARVGDLVITKEDEYEDGYLVCTAITDQTQHYPGLRILERAKPKGPEVVVASFVLDAYHERGVFATTGDGYWESVDHMLVADDLVDPVPLVEKPDIEELVEAVVAAQAAWLRGPQRNGGLATYVREAIGGVLR